MLTPWQVQAPMQLLSKPLKGVRVRFYKSISNEKTQIPFLPTHLVAVACSEPTMIDTSDYPEQYKSLVATVIIGESRRLFT